MWPAVARIPTDPPCTDMHDPESFQHLADLGPGRHLLVHGRMIDFAARQIPRTGTEIRIDGARSLQVG